MTEKTKISRRNVLASGAALLSAGAASLLGKNPLLASTQRAAERQALPKGSVPVVTPNGSSLPWHWEDGCKTFHLIAEPVVREFAPGLKVNCWGYNGQTPGPTIEAVEGERVRIYLENRLPEPTSMHWHGVLLPNGMDGVVGLNQRPIQPGETYKYEWVVRQHGTQMYHPHFDEMVQQSMGMMGFLIFHPKRPARRIDRDFAIFLNEWAIKPGHLRPRSHGDARLQRLHLQQPGLPRHRAAARQARRPGAHPHRQHQHGLPPHPHPRPHLPLDGQRRRAAAGDGVDPRDQHQRPAGHHARRGVRRRQPRRLGVPLPQDAPHHEPDGAQPARHDGRGPVRGYGEGRRAGPRLLWPWAVPAWGT